MTDKQIKKYCDGLDCAICNEKEPCIYKIANELEEKLSAKEQQIENLNKLTEQQNKNNINLTTKLGERILKNGELYNQLKAKEQECEELKDKIIFMEEYIKIVENARNELVKESKFLKEENTEIRKYQYEQDFLKQQLDQLKAENEELKRQIKVKGNILKLTNEAKNEYLDGNNKLKQTLTEIKEIIFPKNQLIITDSPIILKIQEKISEVEQ